MLPLARELGVGFVPYFPLASGLLTGKYRRGGARRRGSRLEGRDDRLTAETFDRVEALDGFAQERGHTLLELAIGALASTPGVASVIAGATTPEQVRANAAAGAWVLGADDLAALARLSYRRSEPGVHDLERRAGHAVRACAGRRSTSEGRARRRRTSSTRCRTTIIPYSLSAWSTTRAWRREAGDRVVLPAAGTAAPSAAATASVSRSRSGAPATRRRAASAPP